jgi:hypothetical protein
MTTKRAATLLLYRAAALYEEKGEADIIETIHRPVRVVVHRSYRKVYGKRNPTFEIWVQDDEGKQMNRVSWGSATMKRAVELIVYNTDPEKLAEQRAETLRHQSAELERERKLKAAEARLQPLRDECARVAEKAVELTLEWATVYPAFAESNFTRSEVMNELTDSLMRLMREHKEKEKANG